MNWWSEGVPEGEESIQHNYVSILSPTQSFRSSPLWSRLLHSIEKKCLHITLEKEQLYCKTMLQGWAQFRFYCSNFGTDDFQILQFQIDDFLAVWPCNLTDDLEKQQGTTSKQYQAFCIFSSPCVNSNWSYRPGVFDLRYSENQDTGDRVNARRWLLPGYWILYAPV